MVKRTLFSLGMVTVLAASSLQAQLVTDPTVFGPSTTLTEFGQHNTNVGDGYSAMLPGPYNIFLSYIGNRGLYFDYPSWGLGPNGSASGNSVGINQAGILRFDFLSGPVNGVGLLMNYAPTYGPVFIRALDVSHNTLAQYEMTADAPIIGNPFQFRGIQMAGISSFELEGVRNSSPIFRSMTFSQSPSTTVPEPSTVILLGTGLLGLGVVAWRRKEEED